MTEREPKRAERKRTVAPTTEFGIVLTRHRELLGVSLTDLSEKNAGNMTKSQIEQTSRISHDGKALMHMGEDVRKKIIHSLVESMISGAKILGNTDPDLLISIKRSIVEDLENAMQ